MIYKKMFFPIGGGALLEERLYGAFLIAKYFDTDLEVLYSYLKKSITITDSIGLPKDIQESIDEVLEEKYKGENDEFLALVEKVKKDLDLENSEKINVKMKEGVRSYLVEKYSKLSDIVIAAAPPSGIATATFETAVLKSGKSVLMFPRALREFSLDSILIGWNNSPEVSKALTSSIELLKIAKNVEIISSEEYIKKDDDYMEEILAYLDKHGIKANYKIVKTTRIPGQALLNHAVEGKFDLVVAGAYGHKGLKELMFGGTTRYLLENAKIPVFLAH